MFSGGRVGGTGERRYRAGDECPRPGSCTTGGGQAKDRGWVLLARHTPSPPRGCGKAPPPKVWARPGSRMQTICPRCAEAGRDQSAGQGGREVQWSEPRPRWLPPLPAPRISLPGPGRCGPPASQDEGQGPRRAAPTGDGDEASGLGPLPIPPIPRPSPTCPGRSGPGSAASPSCAPRLDSGSRERSPRERRSSVRPAGGCAHCGTERAGGDGGGEGGGIRG